jgi:hypothetical protein
VSDDPASSPGGLSEGPTRARPSRAAIRRELRQLARDFADQLVTLLEGAGFWDEGALGDGDDEPKRVRRSPGTLDEVKDRIVEELRGLGGPVGIGAVANALGMKSRQITHPMSLLVEEGKVQRGGVRRGARYEIAGKKKKAPAPKRAKKKKAAKRR